MRKYHNERFEETLKIKEKDIKVGEIFFDEEIEENSMEFEYSEEIKDDNGVVCGVFVPVGTKFTDLNLKGENQTWEAGEPFAITEVLTSGGYKTIILEGEGSDYERI